LQNVRYIEFTLASFHLWKVFFLYIDTILLSVIIKFVSFLCLFYYISLVIFSLFNNSLCKDRSSWRRRVLDLIRTHWILLFLWNILEFCFLCRFISDLIRYFRIIWSFFRIIYQSILRVIESLGEIFYLVVNSIYDSGFSLFSLLDYSTFSKS